LSSKWESLKRNRTSDSANASSNIRKDRMSEKLDAIVVFLQPYYVVTKEEKVIAERFSAFTYMVSMHGIFASRFLNKKGHLISDSNTGGASRSVKGGSWLLISDEKKRMLKYLDYFEE
jgi:hypothetical protein